MQRPRIFLATLAALTLLAPPSTWAQAPSPGDYYEDSVELGFKIRMPKGWSFAPAQPGDPNAVGTYAPPNVDFITLSGNDLMTLQAHLVKFDRREVPAPKPEEGEAPRRRRGVPSLLRYVEERFPGTAIREVKTGEFRLQGVDATEHLFEGSIGSSAFNIWAVKFALGPDLDVAVAFNAPARDLRKWQTGFTRMAKSFRVLEVAEKRAAEGREGDSAYRTQKREQLMREVARNPGWELHETPNYFIVSSVDDKPFMRELLTRLEAIRAVYEELYPAEEAERIRVLARNRELAEEKQKEKDGPAEPAGAPEDGEAPAAGDGDPDADEPPAVPQGTRTGTSPRELSRCSVVRVCTSEDQYIQYGGPRGSAGYWNFMTEELVLFDDKASGGRRNTWAVLNHEAFHQYIFYFYGNISPHYWYNEGTGDFFSGYQYQHGRFTVRKFDWRERTIQQMIRSDTFVPLREFVRFGRKEYYGEKIGENYAQGWSFIYFLRTAKRSSNCWDTSWDRILDVYLETLAATRDLDAAVEKAFQGVDWKKLEDCWKSYIQG